MSPEAERRGKEEERNGEMREKDKEQKRESEERRKLRAIEVLEANLLLKESKAGLHQTLLGTEVGGGIC